jgi:two-component system, NarL family, invasion response regulator UvrY
MTQPRPTTSDDATRQVRVLTVDDQAMFRDAARDVIEATPGFVAVGEASGGEEALEAVRRLRPDLVLCDVRMPGMDGVEVANRLADSHPDTVVVLISIEEPLDVVAATRRASAARLVRKQEFGPRLLRELWPGARRP